ncbi:MAG: hypothetical protein AB8B55_24415 [Mariniblastus sp.]
MRTPKPFFRKQTKSWYVQLGKRQINLGRDEKAAWKKYHELMLEENEPASIDYVVDLLDEYLDWLFKNRKKSTYDKAKHYLIQFASFVGKKLKVGQLTPRQVSKWIEAKTTWRPATRSQFRKMLLEKRFTSFAK